jgi:hypothetical protein
MSAMSNYLETAFLDHFLGRAATSAPSNVYVSLWTSDPTDAGSGTEVSASGYARQAITWNAASSGAITNAAVVDFPAAGASWSTITHFGIHTASTSGQLLFHGALSSSQAIATNDIFRLAAGGITITAA